MARPRAQVRGGRVVLVESAVQNFTELGYHGTSMRDLARTAGVTVASIYHHFSSKQEILQQIMVGTMTDVLALTGAALDEAGPTPTERLGALVEAWVLFHTGRQAEALIGASELRSLDEGGRAAVVALRDEQEAVFRAVVEAGVADGEFATTHPLEAARAIINMGYSIATWYRAGGPVTPEEMAGRYRDLALATVLARSVTGA
ncbi:TetR/AcrR family transcriptional regulator [Nocardioides dongxiaopingii]|uniref:TetR/AcrR family transcriptional regulator n=1 Tax=Nocardioides TaxID=1839 RepID=UPI0010C762B6|nr:MULTISPECIES: TetR/AcrR family transcriptional regulator [Nocardioides]QCW49633.1 TetR/AcrR family transcriptional regulator [Nocardioides sp. S-1144]